MRTTPTVVASASRLAVNCRLAPGSGTRRLRRCASELALYMLEAGHCRFEFNVAQLVYPHGMG
jgi:hypothetical protein